MKRIYLAAAFLLAATSFSQAEKQLVGQSLPGAAGNYVKSQKLLGKPLILEFWATYCPFCLANIPHLNKLFAANKAKGLQVVALPEDDGFDQKTQAQVQAAVKKVTDKHPIQYSVGYDPKQAVFRSLDLDSYPYAYVLNQSGKVVWQGNPTLLGQSVVNKALKP